MAKPLIEIPDSPNLKIFRDLSRTDPKATKGFTKAGGFSGTQIDPQWRSMRLTEYFGPCGHGWGGEQVAYTITEGVAFVCMKLWYRLPGSDIICWTPPQWGGSELLKKRRDGSIQVNDEALKMASTDALGKCAALYLGLAADIYLGMFEDSKYRDENEAFYQTKALPENQPNAIEKFERETKEKIDGIKDLESLDKLWKSGVNTRLREMKAVNEEAYGRILSFFSQKKSELLKCEQEAA